MLFLYSCPLKFITKRDLYYYQPENNLSKGMMKCVYENKWRHVNLRIHFHTDRWSYLLKKTIRKINQLTDLHGFSTHLLTDVFFPDCIGWTCSLKCYLDFSFYGCSCACSTRSSFCWTSLPTRSQTCLSSVR